MANYDPKSLRAEEFINHEEILATLAYAQRAQHTITGMAVRTKNHFATACQHFSCKLMNNCLMRRNVYTAIFFCT